MRRDSNRLPLSADTSFSALLLGPSLAQEVKSEDLEVMKCEVAGLIARLTTGKLHQLQLVKTSPSYVNRLVENLVRTSRTLDFIRNTIYE